MINVLRMEMLGAKVIPVESGSNTLKDATNEAIRIWSKEAEDTFRFDRGSAYHCDCGRTHSHKCNIHSREKAGRLSCRRQLR